MRLVFLALLCLACSSPSQVRRQEPREPKVVTETFEDVTLLAREWVADLPTAPGAQVTNDGGTVKLSFTPSGSSATATVKLRRRFQSPRTDGRRVWVSARVRTSAGASARVTAGVTPNQHGPTLEQESMSRSATSEEWTSIDTALDVPADSRGVDVTLLLEGAGAAWFDDVAISTVGPSAKMAATRLSAKQVERLVAVARASALVRYFHPSDQAAGLDWDGFLPQLVESALRARAQSDFLGTLQRAFSKVAPTAVFSMTARGAPPIPPRAAEAQLTRWRHQGLGAPGTPNWSIRDRSPGQRRTSIERSLPVALPSLERCGSATMKAKLRRTRPQGAGGVFLQVMLGGRQQKLESVEVPASARDATLSIDVPATASQLRLGVELVGPAGIAIEAASVQCSSGLRADVDLSQETRGLGTLSMYQWRVERCGGRSCISFEWIASPEEFEPSRDVHVSRGGLTDPGGGGQPDRIGGGQLDRGGGGRADCG